LGGRRRTRSGTGRGGKAPAGDCGAHEQIARRPGLLRLAPSAYDTGARLSHPPDAAEPTMTQLRFAVGPGLLFLAVVLAAGCGHVPAPVDGPPSAPALAAGYPVRTDLMSATLISKSPPKWYSAG